METKQMKTVLDCPAWRARKQPRVAVREKDMKKCVVVLKSFFQMWAELHPSRWELIDKRTIFNVVTKGIKNKAV